MPDNLVSEVWRNEALVRRTLYGWQCVGRYVDGARCQLVSCGRFKDDPWARLDRLEKVPDYLVEAELHSRLTNTEVTQSLQSLCDCDHATDAGRGEPHGGWVLPDNRTVLVFDPFDPDTIPFASLDQKTAELVRKISADRRQEQCTPIDPTKRDNGEPTRGLIVTIDGKRVKAYYLQKDKCGRCYRITAAGIEQARRDCDSSPTAADVPQTNTQPPARHSPDFRSVRWFGTDYSFTATQAAMVKMLWEAWEHGTPDVGGDTLLELVDSKTSRLVDSFRKSPAWGTLIVDGSTKGSKRLAPSPES